MLKLDRNDSLAEDFFKIVLSLVIRKKARTKHYSELVIADYFAAYVTIPPLITMLGIPSINNLHDLVTHHPVVSNHYPGILTGFDVFIKLYNKLISSDSFKALIQSMNIKSCPYCNRNFIEVVSLANKSKSKFRTSQMDHFLDKAAYPWFAVSFYNLIPVCGVCNHTKSTLSFKVNPYNMADNDSVKFNIMLHRANYLSTEDFEILIAGDADLRHDCNILHLTELYQLHKDQVVTLFKKKSIYTPVIIEEISRMVKMLGYSDVSIKSLIFGIEPDQKRYIETPLSKLRTDILEILSK